MAKKIIFFSVWGLSLAALLVILPDIRMWNWVLFLYTLMLAVSVTASYLAITRPSKKAWKITIMSEAGSLLAALCLMFFLASLSGLDYLFELAYSVFAAIIFELTLFVSIIILCIQKKRIDLAVITLLIEIVILTVIIVLII
jgi:hypothetical protein